MKRQIVLEDDQLIEMVNESARRVLRGLMTEDFWGPFHDSANDLADRFGKNNEYGEVSPEVINALKTLANSENGRDILNAFDDHAEEGFHKLCVTHPEIITTLATNPTLAYNMTRDNNFVTNLCNNEQLAQQFGADANSVAAQYGYGTEAQGGMGFVQQGAGGGSAADVKYAGTDMNGQPIFTNAQGQIVQGIMQYGQDQNGNPIFVDGNGNIVNIDTGQGQQGQEQQGNWWTNALAGTTIGDMLGIQNPNQAQYSDDQALMYLQNMTNADVQIADIEAQIAQMEKKDPNNPALGGLKANLQLLNNQKQMYQPYLQGYYSNLTKQCGDLEAKIRSGQQLTPDEMNRYSQANQTLMAINGSPAYQYMASTQGNQGNQGLFPNNPTLNKIASFLGFNGAGLNNNQQQQQGTQSAQTAQATAQQPQNAQGGQQRQRQPQQQRPVAQQQRPVAQQRQPRQPAQRPAVVDTGATNQATQQPAAPAQPATPVQPQTPQAPTNRVMNPQGGAGQPQPQPQGQPQPQAQPGQPTVATHGAGGQQGQPNPQQVPGRTIQAGALNTTPNRYVAGYNPNFKPNNMQVRPMQVPQYPYQQQRR